MPRARKSSIPDHRSGELALIERIRQRSGSGSSAVRLGIGDDCALLGVKPGEEIAITTDLSISGRHFRLDWHPPEAVGHRTLVRGLSDLAAMGARPVAAFLSLGLPRDLATGKGSRRSWIDHFFDGFLALAAEYQAPLAGGDLAESPVAIADIVLIGAVPKGHAFLRSGARPGDLLYVTGALGGSAAGLDELGKNSEKRSTVRSRPGSRDGRLAAHLWPQPRIQQGLWLQCHGAATAAIDISDGLSTDLDHLCMESGVAAVVEAASLPVFEGASMSQALHGGEDYELLFTARPGTRIPKRIGGVRISQIGRITKASSGRPRVVLVTDATRQLLQRRGWEHFASMVRQSSKSRVST